MTKRIADRYGQQAAVRWVKTMLGFQAKIPERALRAAIASGSVQAIAKVVNAAKLQKQIARAVRAPLLGAAQSAGREGVSMLSAYGITIQFDAVHADVVRFARRQAAELVVDIPTQTKQVIAEVIAMGAQRGLTVVEQASAIREVVGLPPNWARAPQNLADELWAGETSKATRRRLSGVEKQQIRKRIREGTVDKAFVKSITQRYLDSLIQRRALNIARTESLTASHHGLHQSWMQGRQQGVFPASTRKFWEVTDDARLSPQHRRIPGMNPNGRKIHEPFLTTEGLHMYPPCRPNCRCGVSLGFGRRRVA